MVSLAEAAAARRYVIPADFEGGAPWANGRDGEDLPPGWLPNIWERLSCGERQVWNRMTRIWPEDMAHKGSACYGRMNLNSQDGQMEWLALRFGDYGASGGGVVDQNVNVAMRPCWEQAVHPVVRLFSRTSAWVGDAEDTVYLIAGGRGADGKWAMRPIGWPLGEPPSGDDLTECVFPAEGPGHEEAEWVCALQAAELLQVVDRCWPEMVTAFTGGGAG